MSPFLAHNPTSWILLGISAAIMGPLVMFVLIFFTSHIMRLNCNHVVVGIVRSLSTST